MAAIAGVRFPSHSSLSVPFFFFSLFFPHLSSHFPSHWLIPGRELHGNDSPVSDDGKISFFSRFSIIFFFFLFPLL
jgi:hypothetical protein